MSQADPALSVPWGIQPSTHLVSGALLHFPARASIHEYFSSVAQHCLAQRGLLLPFHCTALQPFLFPSSPSLLPGLSFLQNLLPSSMLHFFLSPNPFLCTCPRSSSLSLMMHHLCLGSAETLSPHVLALLASYLLLSHYCLPG